MMKKVSKRLLVFIFFAFCTIELFYGELPSIFSFRKFFYFVENKIKNDKENFKLNEEIIPNLENNIGFNAHVDFYKDSINSNDYAILGDSFVASRQTGVFNSIAYILDSNLQGQKIYNFGIVEGNINDYYLVYDEYNLKYLKKVFVLLTGSNDLIYSVPYMSNTSGPYETNSKTIKLIQQKINRPPRFSSPNYKLINNELRNTVLIVHNGLNVDVLRENGVGLDIISVNIGAEHQLSDGHYTRRGNEIISEKILNYLNKK